MIAEKKKTSAKRTVKYAAKAQSSARQTSASKAGNASWVNSNSADWQKGASDWAKQSAKMYQLPFAQADMGAATQQAADQVKSATEKMVKMGTDAMQQMFGQQNAKASASQMFNPAAFFEQMQQQMPKMADMSKFQMPKMPAMPEFDMASAQEKLAAFTREASEQASKASKDSTRAAAEAVELSRENIAAITEVCNTAVSVSKELVAETTTYLNKQFTQNVELSKQLLTCRTLNDMFDLSTRITKANLDGFFSQSVKISEMLFQCATDVAEPLNARATDTSERIAKAMQA